MADSFYGNPLPMNLFINLFVDNRVGAKLFLKSLEVLRLPAWNT